MDNFLRVGLLLAVLVLAASTVWLGAIDKTEAAMTTAALCFGLCIFVFLYRFKRFKGLGFEGELWEQEMEKAAELRRILKDLSQRVGEYIFWQLGPGSRWTDTTKQRFSIIERTQQNLEAVGIDRQEIEELKRPWHKVVMRDLANPITERVSDAAKRTAEQLEKKIRDFGGAVPAEKAAEYDALHKELGALRDYPKQLNKLIWRDDYENVPRLLREEIDGSPWLTADDRQAIYSDCAEEFRDVDQYARDRTVRRPEVLKL